MAKYQDIIEYEIGDEVSLGNPSLMDYYKKKYGFNRIGKLKVVEVKKVKDQNGDYQVCFLNKEKMMFLASQLVPTDKKTYDILKERKMKGYQVGKARRKPTNMKKAEKLAYNIKENPFNKKKKYENSKE